MDRPRLRLVAALLAIATVSACGGANSTQLPAAPTAAPTVAATPTASPAPTGTPASSVTNVTVASATAQTLPTIGGGTATVSLAAVAGTAANASVAVTVSSTPPSGAIAIAAAARRTLALSRIALAYYTFVPSVDIQLASFPSFTISYPTSLLPAGTTIKEAFLDAGTGQPVFTYDIAFGTSGATFTSTAIAPKLLAGKAYIFAFYYETGNTATATPSATPTATATPTASPTPTPTTTASATPTPVPTAIGFASGSATFTVGAGYNGLAGAIMPLVTTEGGVSGNATFESTTQGAPSFYSGTSANPLRQIVLEINDSVRISNSTTYTTVGSNSKAVLLYYSEYYTIGGTIMSRNWIANGGTVTFENVGNGAATYRLRGATFIPDASYTANPAAGTFTLDAVGTANPYTSN
jgi:hypothetical protein